MKAVVLCLLSLTIVSSSWAQTSTLRHFDPDQATFSYPSGFREYVARFEPEHSGFISSLLIEVTGPAGGELELSMYGHEGGTAFPQFEQALFPFVKLQKQKNGKEIIRYELPAPIEVQNTQFFVVLKNLSSGVQVMSDIRPAESSCHSSSGGNYYFQYVKTLNNTWALGIRRAFAISVLIDYSYRNHTTWLDDVTAAWNIDSNLSNRSISCADVDNDGMPDLLIAGKLYRNEGNGQFKELNSELGIEGNPRAGLIIPRGTEWADLYFFMHGSGSYRYRWERDRYIKEELNGFPIFESISSISASDLNEDGKPDFFIGQLWGSYPEPKPNYLMMSQFEPLEWEDRSDLLYPRHDGQSNDPTKMRCDAGNQNSWIPDGNQNKRSRGSQFTDFDNDGDPDLYVTNYFLEEDEFYENLGDGTFRNIIAQKNIDQNNTGHNHGTGVSWEDFDADGDLDLLLPQFAHPAFSLQHDHRSTTLYENQGAPDFSFIDQKGSHGIEFEETYAGASWGDINNDGRSDFVETVFYGCRYVKLYVQQDDKSFRLMSHEAGLNKLNTGEDAIWADLDGDGKQELILGKSGRIRIFKNQWPTKTAIYHSNDWPVLVEMNWIGLDLKDKNGNRFLPGTSVEIEWSGGLKRKEVQYGQGVRMQSPQNLHFGLGPDKAAKSITVHWPDGSSEQWFQKQAGKNHVLQQGHGDSKKTDLLIYGNPVKEILRFRIGPSDLPQEALITDMQGRTVLQFDIRASEQAQWIEKGLQHIQSGPYVLHLSTETKHQSNIFILL